LQSSDIRYPLKGEAKMNRESKSEAQKVIEKLFPEKEARKAYLKMFSEAIAKARSHGDKKWGVTLHSDRIRLIIGNIVVCTLHKGHIWFVLPGEAYPDYTSPKEIPGWDTDYLEYKSIPSIAGYYQYSKDYHDKAWPQIKAQHFTFLELAAQKCKILNAKSRKKYSPGVLEYLKLPEPEVSVPIEEVIKIVPKLFKSVIDDIKILKQDTAHTEKAHEALVVSFYETLGYKKFLDIKYQLSKIDIAIQAKKNTIIVNEVKKNWKLKYPKDLDVVKQANNYAKESGSRYFVITNGDYYALFDQTRGLSFDDNLVFEFWLTNLKKKDLDNIELLLKDRLLAKI